MKILTLENRHELQPYMELADYNEYNSNIVTMLMWHAMYEVHFEVFEHFALVYTSMPNRSSIWMMPYCDVSYRRAALAKMQELSTTLSIPYEIHSMTLEFKNWLQEVYPFEFLIWDCYDARDYVYDRKQQESLAGKKMQKRRNHFHAFEKEYAGRYTYKALEEEDIPHIYALLDRWKARKEEDESIDAEDAGIHLLLSHLQDLPIQGGCIYIDGQLEAFNITSKLSKDTIEVHVEKANRAIRGLYIAILKLFLETVEEDILYVNREDDMGLMELRKAKCDMQPIFTIKKFGCVQQNIYIRKAMPEDIPHIKALWLDRFDEENEQTSAYFFEHFFQIEDCSVLVSEGELISMLQTRFMDVVIAGKKQAIPFLFGVATQDEYEGCAYMKLLMNHVLKELANIAPFAFIQAHNWDIYRSFGFHECYDEAITKLDKKMYTVMSGVNSYEITTNELLLIYQNYVQHKDGWRIRDEAYYENIIPYKALFDEHCLIHRTDGQADAYVFYREQEGELHVSECIYTNEQALHGMLAQLGEQGQKIYVHTDIETELAGRRKTGIVMMIKELQSQAFPQEHLFISEEI